MTPLAARAVWGTHEAPAAAGASQGVVGTGVDPVTYRFSGDRSAD
jgi:hypothetical protein